MNLFDLLFVVLWIGCGIAGGLFLKKWGLIGEIIGFGCGMVLAFGVFRLLNFVIDTWIPETPHCLCGSQGKHTYKFCEWSKDEKGAIAGGIYRCQQCGRRYLKTKRQFDEVFEDGATRPYMMHSLFGRWQRITADAGKL